MLLTKTIAISRLRANLKEVDVIRRTRITHLFWLPHTVSQHAHSQQAWKKKQKTTQTWQRAKGVSCPTSNCFARSRAHWRNVCQRKMGVVAVETRFATSARRVGTCPALFGGGSPPLLRINERRRNDGGSTDRPHPSVPGPHSIPSSPANASQRRV